MKRILSFIIVSLMIMAAAFTVIADNENTYAIQLETAKEKYKINEEVYVNASITDISAANGLIAIEMVIEYDPKLLKAVKGDTEEIAETNLPDAWKENGEKTENIVTDENANQTGRIKLIFTAPMDENGIYTPSIAGSEYYVIVKFECLGEGNPIIRIDPSNKENCATGYDKEGNVVNYTGKGSEVTFEITSENKTTDESTPDQESERDYTLYYIIVGSAVAVCAAILVITKLRKK